MAIIHHQFESIHPFYDWNWRTGRIINILYLIKNDLLDMPILYLSNYIIKNKWDYYRLLQEVREKDSWEEWILYMLDAIEKTSLDTIEIIKNIWDLMWKTKKSLKENLPKIYSKDLLEIIFSHPYTKIDFLVDWMWITRKTWAKYLNELVDNWYMFVLQIWKHKYFVNIELFELLKKWL
jgi:Fic family protein